MDNIIPGHSIRNFVLGQKIVEHPNFKEFQKVAEFRYEWRHIKLRVNSEGRIDLISTGNGTYGEIATGQSFRQVIDIGHKLLYDEFDQLFYLIEPPGLCIEKKYENLHVTELLNSKIQYLSVFDINKNKEFATDKDFETITRDNIAEFELKNCDSEQFLKRAIKQFKLSKDSQLKSWWKMW